MNVWLICWMDSGRLGTGASAALNVCVPCHDVHCGCRPASGSTGSKRMSAEVFFDTDVLLYLLSGEPGKHGQRFGALAVVNPFVA